LWLHPNRTSLGWAQIRQPDPTIVVLDVDHLQFSLVKDISIRIPSPRYVANDPIRSPSYVYDASKRREQYVKYLAEPSISLLVRQFSFLHWLKREQQAFSNTTVTFRPFHASQLLRSFESQNDSATVLTTLSHLDHHLATSQFEELVRFLGPPVFRASATTFSDVEQKMLQMLRNVHRPFTYVKVHYGPYGVSGEKLIGTILDFPDDFTVFDEYGNEFSSNDALDQQLIAPEQHQQITEWLDAQTGKLGRFNRNIVKLGNKSTLTAYVATFKDPYSKPEHAKTPKWDPAPQQQAATTSKSQ
jgi:hypothetical protein